jgi:hypothetical protein
VGGPTGCQQQARQLIGQCLIGRLWRLQEESRGEFPGGEGRFEPRLALGMRPPTALLLGFEQGGMKLFHGLDTLSGRKRLDPFSHGIVRSARIHDSFKVSRQLGEPRLDAPG